jgi:chromosome segregation ATPase
MLRVQPEEQNKNQQVEDTKQELATLVCVINDTKLEIEGLQKQKDISNQELLAIDVRLSDLKKEEEALMTSLDESKKIHSDYIAQVNQTKAESDKLSVEYAGLLTQIDQARNDHQTLLSTQNTESADNLKQLQAAIEIKNSELSAIKKANKDLVDSSEYLKGIVAEADVTHSNKIQEIAELDSEIRSQKQTIEQNKQLNISTSSSVTSRQTALAELDKLIAEKRESQKSEDTLLALKHQEVVLLEQLLQEKKEAMLGLVRREERLNEVIPRVKELAEKMGITIDI